MKILLIAVLTIFISMPVMGQQMTPTKKVDLSAGDYLIRSKKRTFTALVVGIGGTGIGMAAASTSPDNKGAAFAISGTFALIGIIIECGAIADLGHAGAALNKAALTMNMGKDGLGLKLSF